MKTSPRRALSAILAAALLLGSVPQGVQAQVVRVAGGQTGSMPVSPVSVSPTGMTLAPALGIDVNACMPAQEARRYGGIV